VAKKNGKEKTKERKNMHHDHKLIHAWMVTGAFRSKSLVARNRKE
jgi:hypothetical protein